MISYNLFNIIYCGRRQSRRLVFCSIHPYYPSKNCTCIGDWIKTNESSYMSENMKRKKQRRIMLPACEGNARANTHSSLSLSFYPWKMAYAAPSTPSSSRLSFSLNFDVYRIQKTYSFTLLPIPHRPLFQSALHWKWNILLMNTIDASSKR